MKRNVESSFIESVSYSPLRGHWRRMFPGLGFLTVTIRETDYVYLVPSWTAGLMAAADACPALSVGQFYNWLVKPQRAIAANYPTDS